MTTNYIYPVDNLCCCQTGEKGHNEQSSRIFDLRTGITVIKLPHRNGFLTIGILPTIIKYKMEDVDSFWVELG